ncbi:hypothetical protein C8R46DRAFT_1219232 [Mycena filopes]|nr:hypothetical protein C8R46DRAFT_1219232 [Mycena filopes]
MTPEVKFAEIKDALLEGVKSLKKWSHRVERTSSAYFICPVLNPSIKDVYFRNCWEPEECGKEMKVLGDIFNRYYAAAAASCVLSNHLS